MTEEHDFINEKPLAGGTRHAPDKKRRTLTGKCFVFTAAQNNTYVHKAFLASLQTYCKHHNAALVVSPFTYNKNGFQSSGKDDEGLWYDPLIKDYLVSDDVFVTPWDDLVFCGALNILPTAVNPLSGLQSYCQHASGIIPHAKVRMESLPRLKGEDPRFLYTTGACTTRNYIQKKEGQKASFHHVFGALVVEVNEDTGHWHARQLIANSEDGTFQDLTTVYTPTGFNSNIPAEAINWGDIHAEKTSPEVAGASWWRYVSADSLLDALHPKYQFVHDLTDFTARNHHNINDPYFMFSTWSRGESSVEHDLVLSGEMLDDMHRPWCKTVVVDSNHHTALRTWLTTAGKTIANDPENARIFHKLNYEVLTAIEDNRDFNVYEYALKLCTPDFPEDVIFLGQDESFLICPDSGGVECGLHGHVGPNGSRGSPNNLKNVGRKLNTGHTHSAGIVDGVYTAGVSAYLDMGYNKGPSSWSHSHIVTYSNGKRTIITIKDGEYR